MSRVSLLPIELYSMYCSVLRGRATKRDRERARERTQSHIHQQANEIHSFTCGEKQLRMEKRESIIYSNSYYAHSTQQIERTI